MLVRYRRDERGFVMVTVLLVVFVLLLAGTAILDRSVGSQFISRRDQDWNAALAAAEAGIDDYLFRLNNSPVIPPSTSGNTAIGGWAPVPGPSNGATFSYYVDSSTLPVDGTIKLTVSGRVNNVVRTVQAGLRRRNFLDYLYFTDYETTDPARYPLSGSSFNATQAQTYCSKYYYGGFGNQRDVNGRSDFAGDSDSSQAYCADITFISQDVINGPLHTNDTLRIAGNPTYNGSTTTSWNTGPPRYFCPAGGCNPTFALAGDPRFVQPLTLPPSNTSIRQQADGALGGTGCLYTGPTSITLNAVGTMTVRSPFTRSTNSGCGSNLYLNTSGSATVSLPPNGVVFVQSVPASSSDPNYTAGCPFNVNGRAHPLGYPLATGDVTTYACRDGDVFLSGTLSGQLTIASETDIVVVGNVQYATGVAGTDLLGLIPNEYVFIYHPVNSGGSNLTGSLTNPIISAALLSLQHSFTVQNYNRGATLGTLNVTGAIGQRYRGAVGTFSGNPPTIQTGYAKNYVYDNRLQYLSPPYYIDPVQAAWGVVTWAECAPKDPPPPPSTTPPIQC